MASVWYSGDSFRSSTRTPDRTTSTAKRLRARGPKMSEERERESLPDETRAAIEEVRMVLPGMQALFGFQLIAVFNERFDQLSTSLRLAHFGSLILVAIAIALVLEVGVISTVVLHSVLISALISTALAL